MSTVAKDKISRYYELNPTRFRTLLSLSLYQRLNNHQEMSQYLSIIMQDHLSDENQTLALEFADVRGLVIKQPAFSQITIPHLEVSFYEGATPHSSFYNVKDAEQEEFIRLTCGDFVATLKN